MDKLLDYIAWDRHWRGRPPKTAEEVAEDFLREDRNPQNVLDYFRGLPESARRGHGANAWRARIELIYGLVHGWNRDLLRACGTDDPEVAAWIIFDVCWDRVKDLPVGTAHRTIEGGLCPPDPGRTTDGE